MAQPSSGGPDEAETEVARIQAVADNAKKLGLVWGWRPATVITATTPTGDLTATYDGDGAPTNMKSAMGALAIGERIYGQFVPPGGNYAMGRCLPQPLLRARCSDGNISTSSEDIPFNVIDEQLGTWNTAGVPTTTFFIPEPGIYELSATVQFVSAAVAGSRQDITFVFTSSVTSWTSTTYRGSWSNGGAIGTANALLRLNQGDSFRVALVQTSGLTTDYTSYLTAVRKSG